MSADRWTVIGTHLLTLHTLARANYFTGDGSPRTEQASHALLLMTPYTTTLHADPGTTVQ